MIYPLSYAGHDDEFIGLVHPVTLKLKVALKWALARAFFLSLQRG